MDANSRNYRNYNHTYRNGLFFFFFFQSHGDPLFMDSRFYQQRGHDRELKRRRRKNRGFFSGPPFPSRTIHDIVSPPIWISYSSSSLRIKREWRIVAIHFENCTRRNRVFNRGPLRAKNLDDLSR